MTTRNLTEEQIHKLAMRLGPAILKLNRMVYMGEDAAEKAVDDLEKIVNEQTPTELEKNR